MHPNISWLDSLASRGIRPGLDSIRELMTVLGNPQDRLRTIHVAGSDGKGSVCCMLESILLAAGFRVGMFNTPHIMRVNESIRINGIPVDDETLDHTLSEVRAAAESVNSQCTGFESLTACAFVCFEENHVDYAIIEVGMGGEMDATNIIVPEVSIINNISMEHTAFLGDTIEEIALQKAGIMKKDVPCVTLNSGPALEVLRKHSIEVGCPLTVVDPEELTLISNQRDGPLIRYKCQDFKVGIPGRCQSLNAALAIETVRSLESGKEIAPFLAIGLESATWPFRLQCIDDRVVIDVTHTKKGSEFLAEDVSEIYGKVILVTGMLDDKDIEGVARTLSPIASKVLVSSPNSPRAAATERIADAYAKFRDDVESFRSIGEAMEQALKNDGTILVTGSFRTAEDCIRWMEETK